MKKALGIGSVSVALLAVAYSFSGPHLVRAKAPEIPAIQEVDLVPIVQAIEGVEERLARVEATVGDLASTYSSKQATQELCVSDESGQTCITKTQLDALLRMHARVDVNRAVVAMIGSAADSPAEAAAVKPAQLEASPSPIDTASEPVTGTAEDVAAAPAQIEEPTVSEAAAEPATGTTEQVTAAPSQSSEPAASEATAEANSSIGEDIAAIPAPAKVDEPAEAPAPVGLEQPQDAAAIQVELDQLEQTLAAQAGLEQPDETVAKEVQEIVAAQKQRDDAASSQLGAAQIEAIVPAEAAAPEASNIAAARVYVQEDQEPVITGSMSSSGASIPVETSGAVELTPPEDISPPETQPAFLE